MVYDWMSDNERVSGYWYDNQMQPPYPITAFDYRMEQKYRHLPVNTPIVEREYEVDASLVVDLHSVEDMMF